MATPIQETAQEERVVVPRLWDEAVLRDWALPVAGLGVPLNAAPVDDLRTYPACHPDREPEGYRERLPEQLRTKADWIAAGERIFLELDTALRAPPIPRCSPTSRAPRPWTRGATPRTTPWTRTACSSTARR